MVIDRRWLVGERAGQVLVWSSLVISVYSCVVVMTYLMPGLVPPLPPYPKSLRAGIKHMLQDYPGS